MDTYVYIWIEGERFSPREFQKKLEPKLRGTIEYRKKLRDGVVERTGEHWKSPKIQAVNHTEVTTRLHSLLERLRPALIAIRHEENTVCAELVSDFSESQEVRGFYLPFETITLLAEVGASFDFDQYHRTE